MALVVPPYGVAFKRAAVEPEPGGFRCRFTHGHFGVHAVFPSAGISRSRSAEHSPFRTGGKGLVGGDIDEQGAIRVHGPYLLAVNPSSDSIAVLRRGNGGQLTPVSGSPFASAGSAPFSVT